IRAVIRVKSSKRLIRKRDLCLDKGAGCANLHLGKHGFPIDSLKALGKECEPPQKALDWMPRRGKAILEVEHAFQKERRDIADESELFRYRFSTVPALAHDFSSARFKLVSPCYCTTGSLAPEIISAMPAFHGLLLRLAVW